MSLCVLGQMILDWEVANMYVPVSSRDWEKKKSEKKKKKKKKRKKQENSDRDW